MFSRVRSVLARTVPFVVFVSGITAASIAGAVTVNLSTERFERADLTRAQTARASWEAGHTLTNVHRENFDDHSAWNGTSGTSDPQNTKVGSFTASGTHGSGRSVINGGTATEVRNDNDMFWGRYNTNAENLLGGNYLDSNDNRWIDWTISGLGRFNTLSFFVIDAADVGGIFSINVGDTHFTALAGGDGKLANGNIHMVTITLSEAVSSLNLRLGHDRSNDGFGIDGATVALAPVPLPAAAWLLIGGIGALGVAARRRRAAKA
jgi:hypothetical protein